MNQPNQTEMPEPAINETEQRIIEIRKASPEATQKEIGQQVNRSKERVRQVLKKHNLPTASSLRVTHDIRCPECNSGWVWFAKRENAWGCRTCGCLFVLEGDAAKVLRHGGTCKDN